MVGRYEASGMHLWANLLGGLHETSFYDND